jgi:hypothetical protein
VKADTGTYQCSTIYTCDETQFCFTANCPQPTDVGCNDSYFCATNLCPSETDGCITSDCGSYDCPPDPQQTIYCS